MKLSKPQVRLLAKAAQKPFRLKGNEWMTARKLKSMGLLETTFPVAELSVLGRQWASPF